MNRLKELHVEWKIKENIKLFEFDISSKCIYFYDGMSIKKSCWNNKGKDFEESKLIKRIEGVNKMYLTMTGKNMIYSTNKAIYFMNVDTKYTRTYIELPNIHYFMLFERKKYIIYIIKIYYNNNNSFTMQSNLGF